MHRRQVGLGGICRRRAPRGRTSIQKTPQFVDFTTRFEFFDRGDHLVEVEKVEKIVDGPHAIPLAGSA